MTNTWFTSDTHFGHTNIIKYSKRPFETAQEMDEAMIRNWNDRVQPDDIVWHLGDFGFSDSARLQSIFDRLNGNKYFCIGNHDKATRQVKGWKFFGDYAEITVEGQFMVLSHYAFRVWNRSHKGAYHLYGHSHGSLPDDPNALSFDVGVDCHNYAPISFPEVQRIMKKKNFKPIDHHGRT